MEKKQILYSACVMSSAFGLLLGIVYGFVVTQATSATYIHYDEQIASSQKPLIQESINKILLYHYSLCYSCTPLLFSQLQKELPGLVLVTVSTQVPGRMKITLKVDDPILAINQANASPQILLARGGYAPVEQYEKTFLANLPTLLLVSKNFNKEEQNALFNWVKKLPDSFFKHYSVCWYTRHKIILHDIKYPHFEYIVTNENLYSADVEKKLTDLRISLNEKKPNKKWHIDLRFKDQYVVSEKIMEKNNILPKKSITKGAVL